MVKISHFRTLFLRASVLMVSTEMGRPQRRCAQHRGWGLREDLPGKKNYLRRSGKNRMIRENFRMAKSNYMLNQKINGKLGENIIYI